MRHRIGHIVFTILLIFSMGLGTSLAGKLPCLPGCPTCEPVPACCQETDSHQATGHSPQKSGCRHGGICLDATPSKDLVISAGSQQYDSAVHVLLPSSGPVPGAFSRLGFRFVPNVFQHKSSPLYLQNCSFLI